MSSGLKYKYMGEDSIYDLIAKCEAFFSQNHYAEISINGYKRRWNRGIIKYMVDRNLEIYSPKIGAEYLENCINFEKIKEGTRLERVRNIRVLNDMLSLGAIRKTSIIPITHRLDGLIGHDMVKFIENFNGKRRSEKTVLHHRRNLSYFLEFLYARDKTSTAEITESDVITYTSVCRNKVSAVTTLKLLFNFWRQTGIVAGFLADFFESFKVKEKERIPSFYSIDEVAKIEHFVNRNSPIGKRDYAMVLLASRLGLRSSDIATLTFSELDWENNMLKKRMQKTGKFIELPLLAEVGNAIIDYLKNARPKSKSDMVFLLGRSPYLPLDASVVSAQINNIIKRTGVDIKGRHHGAHALRHSLASAMLGMNTSIETISETLGHQSAETTMCYLKIDIKSLKKCALQVPSVPDSFYRQRGGAFYEKI